MKHLYRNLICFLLIICAVGGIVLMALNLMDILDDNLSTISRSISGGTNANWGYNISAKEKTVMTVTSNYSGTFYMRSDSWGEPKDSQCTDFKSGEKYTGSTTYNPLGYFTKKVIKSGAKKYNFSVDLESNNTYLLRPDYSELGLDDSKSTDVAAKPSQKQYSGTFYPDVNEDIVKATSFDDEIITAEEETYQKYVHQKYTVLPGNQTEQAELKERLLKYIRDKGMNPDSSTIVSDITNYFNTNYYYAMPDIPKNENYALYFLEKCDHGICNNFASASYYLYRALGIPTRIACGYLVMNPESNGDGTYTYDVKVKQCHAWNEIYVDGSGWKRVDNTASRTDLDDSDFENKNDSIGKISSSVPDYSSGSGDGEGISGGEHISSGKGDGKGSGTTTQGGGEPVVDNVNYGKGIIEIKDQYNKTYDGTQQYMDPNDFFVLSDYTFVEDMDYLNEEIDISSENPKTLNEIIELIGENDEIQYEFKYRNSTRTEPGSYQFVCTSFKIINAQGYDVTKRYGITFVDSNDTKTNISVNKKAPLMTVDKYTIPDKDIIGNTNIDVTELPYTIDKTQLSLYVFNLPNGFNGEFNLPKTTLTMDDFVLSEDMTKYVCTLTPTLTIKDSSGVDRTDNFSFTLKDITFSYKPAE